MATKTPKTIRVVSLRMVREKNLKYENRLSTADDIITMVRPMFAGRYREMVVVVGLDNGSRPTVAHVVGMGSPNQSAVFVSNVFKPLLLSNATSFVLVHNHPGDTLTPSSADLDITARLKQVAKDLDIPFLDHIILDAAAERHYSFRQEGKL